MVAAFGAEGLFVEVEVVAVPGVEDGLFLSASDQDQGGSWKSRRHPDRIMDDLGLIDVDGGEVIGSVHDTGTFWAAEQARC